jgi:hypothetical protein
MPGPPLSRRVPASARRVPRRVRNSDWPYPAVGSPRPLCSSPHPQPASYSSYAQLAWCSELLGILPTLPLVPTCRPHHFSQRMQDWKRRVALLESGGNRSRVGGKPARSEKRRSPRFPSENRSLLASTRVRTSPADLVLFWSPESRDQAPNQRAARGERLGRTRRRGPRGAGARGEPPGRTRRRGPCGERWDLVARPGGPDVGPRQHAPCGERWGLVVPLGLVASV